MSRPKSPNPAYRFHVSGQARVTLAGKDFYLGEHDSPESWAKYYGLLAEYNSNGKKAPKTASHQGNEPITVYGVTGEFREHIKTLFMNNATELGRFTRLCGLLDDLCGSLPAAEFGPRKLAEMRQGFIDDGLARRYCNSQTRNVIRIFRHAVSRELVKPDVLVALETLEPLKIGQTTARESKKRRPVELGVVRETVKHLSPTLRAMVGIQIATGCRPSEVFKMRPMDIDTSGPEWIYRPPSHKTAHHGKARAIPILQDMRPTVEPFIHREKSTPMFSPAESADWYRDQRRTGKPPQKAPVKNPKRRPGTMFTKDSYRRSVERAAKKAKVEHWSPYQLRHLSATEVRKILGAEGVQSHLGHSNLRLVETYAKQAEERAIEAARVSPRL